MSESVVEIIAGLGVGETPVEPLNVGTDEAIVRELTNERILGVAVRGVEAGHIVGGDEVLGAIGNAHDAVMRQSMRIEVEALRVAQTFSDAGIDHRFLKGTALAHTIYDDPALRSFRDVDVLVRGDDIDRAVAELGRLGAARLQPQLRAGYDARFGKSVTLRTNGVEVDLHRVLSPGPFGVWSRPGELFLLRRSYVVAGRTLDTLDPTDHLVHACYHVALGQVTPVLANLRDIAALALSEADPVDFERFDETVQHWRGAAVVRRAVRLTEGRLSVALPEQLAKYRHSSVPRDEQEMLAPYLTDDPSGRFAALAPATLKALPLADRPAFALAVGLPDGADPKERLLSLAKRAKDLRS